MDAAITKTSQGDATKETRSYYGPSLALVRLPLPPPFPYFRRVCVFGERRRVEYIDVVVSRSTSVCSF